MSDACFNELYLFPCNPLRSGYYVSNVTENTYAQNKEEFIMQYFQISVFYDLRQPIRNLPLSPKHYYIFKVLDRSTLPGRNDRIGRIGHPQLAIMRTFIVKHLERIKSILYIYYSIL